MSPRAAMVAGVSAAVLAVILVAVLGMGPSEPDDPITPDVPDPSEEIEIPEGFAYDPVTRTVSTGETVEWKIFDRYHTYMADRSSVYPGYTVVSDRVVLETGCYDISVGDTGFRILVDGDLSRTVSWTYRDGNGSHDLVLDYTIPMKGFAEASDLNREWNISSQALTRYMQFSQMGTLVVVDDTVRSLESSLAREYGRIGGSVDDRQGYADFLACFVQLAIKYPPSVQGRSFDYYVWGMDEYWCVPLETLYHATGDCEDTSALLCSLYIAAGYRAAMGGHAGHVFAGVVIDGFEDRTVEGFPAYKLSGGYGITGTDDDGNPIYNDTYYRSVETIRGQLPVGYLAGGNSNLGYRTFWGYAGLYPVSG